MTTFVHIGTSKTGTTSIQTFLDSHRGQLQARGYCYLAPFSHMLWHKDRLPSLTGALRSALRQASGQHVIISSEILQASFKGAEQVRGFRTMLEELGLNDMRIIIYLRDPAEHFVSTLSQDIRMRFIDDRTPLPLPQHNRTFLSVCNHRATLERWGEVFGRDRLMVRLFSPHTLYRGDVLEDFLQLVGLAWDEAWQHPQRANEAFNLLQMALLRPANRIVSEEAVRISLQGYVSRHLADNADPRLRFAPRYHISKLKADL